MSVLPVPTQNLLYDLENDGVRVMFGDVVENVSVAEPDPAAAGLERYVGLDHLADAIEAGYRRLALVGAPLREEHVASAEPAREGRALCCVPPASKIQRPGI